MGLQSDNSLGAGLAEADGTTFSILAQYIKDVSFESPSGPVSIPSGSDDDLDVDFDVKAQQRSDTDFEVQLLVRAHFRHEERTIWLLDMTYAGYVSFAPEAPTELRQSVLLVDVPYLLFPYLRQLVSEITQGGGYPPLFLHPIRFRQLYEQRAAEAAAQSAQGDVIQ